MNLPWQRSLPSEAACPSEALEDFDLLQCMICFEPFKDPKMLNCAHTFCAKCLEEYYSCYVGQKRAIPGHIPCPNCRELTPWPANGAAGLRTDFKVQQIEDLLKTMSTHVHGTSSLNICGSCIAQGKKIQTKSYCFNCEKSYCGSCTLKHSQNALFNNHRVVAISNKNGRKENKCTNHPEEDCKYLCRTCNSFVCTLCLMNGHTKHEAVELKVAVKEQQENLEVFMASINEKKEGLRRSLGDLEPLTIRCKNACSEAEKSITARTNKVISDVKKQEADYLSQIKSTREKKLSALEAEVDRIKKTLSNFEKMEKMMINTPSTMAESFENYETLMQRMSTILEVDTRQDMRNLITNAVLVDFTPSQEHSNFLGQLSEAKAKPQNYAPPNPSKQRRSFHGSDGKSLPLAEGMNLSPSRRGVSPSSRDFAYPRLLLELNKRGAQRGEFIEPLWVTCLRNSKFVVSEKGNKRLQMFDMSGRHIETISGQSMHPAGVAVTLKGNLIVADSNQKCIEVFSPEGGRLHRWGSGKFFLPCGVAVCPNGNIVISDLGNNTVSVFRSESNCVFLLGLAPQKEQQFTEPLYVIAGPHNEIIISDSKNHCIKIFDSKGKFVTSIGSKGSGDGEFNHPCGVCTDHEGNIFVADYGNDRISLVTRNGTFSSHVLTKEHGIRSPRDLFVTPDGKLIVTESNQSRSAVKIFESSNWTN